MTDAGEMWDPDAGRIAEFKQGPLSAVELTGDPTLLSLVEVQVVNQRLGIRLTDKAMKIKPGSIKATVTVPRLQTLFAHEWPELQRPRSP